MNVGFKDVVSTYKQSGELVVNDIGNWCHARFTDMQDLGEPVIPVLITAFDEEDDITTTLASLARQTLPIKPVVVDNASTDRTAEFANAMGAEVIEEPIKTKMHALKTGLGYCIDQYGAGNILMTDADTVVGSHWAEALIQNMGAPEAKLATQIGSAIYHNIGSNQDSIIVNLLRSFRSVVQTHNYPKKPRGRGHNMGLWIAHSRAGDSLIDSLDAKKVTRTDTHIAEQAVALGGISRACIDPRAVVLTRGDRMTDFSTFVKALISTEFRVVHSYSDWYERAEEHVTI